MHPGLCRASSSLARRAARAAGGGGGAQATTGRLRSLVSRRPAEVQVGGCKYHPKRSLQPHLSASARSQGRLRLRCSQFWVRGQKRLLPAGEQEKCWYSHPFPWGLFRKLPEDTRPGRLTRLWTALCTGELCAHCKRKTSCKGSGCLPAQSWLCVLGTMSEQ